MSGRMWTGDMLHFLVGLRDGLRVLSIQRVIFGRRAIRMDLPHVLIGDVVNLPDGTRDEMILADLERARDNL